MHGLYLHCNIGCRCKNLSYPVCISVFRAHRNLVLFSSDVAERFSKARVYGHGIGILCGYGSLLLLGLQHAGSEMGGGTSVRRLIAVALSLATTAFFMVLLRAAHAPAGATTLIISLGLITRPFHLLVIELAVALLCVQSFVFNRRVGLDYPLWAGPIDSAMEEIRTSSRGRPKLQERKEQVRPKE